MLGTDKFRGTVSKCSVQTPWRELTWKIGIEILLQSTSRLFKSFPNGQKHTHSVDSWEERLCES